MTEHIKISRKQIPTDQATLRTANLLKIIAKAEERLKRQGKTWSVNDQNMSTVNEKKCAVTSVGN